MALEAIQYKRGSLSILNQLVLPFESTFIEIQNVNDAWDAIRQMKVRGAPAIAIVGCLALAKELHDTKFNTKEELANDIVHHMEFLRSARPTAVNMDKAVQKYVTMARSYQTQKMGLAEMKERILLSLERTLEADVAKNKNIGLCGADNIIAYCKVGKYNILTHCNTGSLATAGYGTALENKPLGVIRRLQEMHRLEHVYFTETRPYNQGARLTAYELVHDKLPATLICDSMAGWVFKTKGIDAVVVGADRIVANGDTANKIGTYQLAVLAKHHEVPFYVAAPTSTIDFEMPNGRAIPIEERPHVEMTSLQGIPIAAPGIKCWNPAFDVTPAALITGGIVTEFGVYPAHEIRTVQGRLYEIRAIQEQYVYGLPNYL